MKEFFGTLKMNPSLVSALQKQGIASLTDVQKKVLPEAILNRDLVAQSETGTGKTLAYLLPLFTKIDQAKRETQAIILAPTHELVMQILKQIEILSGNSDMKISSTPIIGNVNIERQIDKLKEKPHIIAGTPGRVIELIKKRKITAHTIRTIIIDEADTLTNENNIKIIKEIVKSTLKERQIMMFSATITKQTLSHAAEMMKDPAIIIDNSTARIPEAIEHYYFLAEERDRIEALRKIIRIIKPQKALVFIGAREDADFIMNRLKFHGLDSSSLHGHNDKADRKKAMDDFRTGKATVMIVSDIAARGLDIEGVTHVFNMDMPELAGNYLHRAGRTGRMGGKGTVISIVTERELKLIGSYEKALKINIVPKAMFKGGIVEVKLKNK